mgnify:CR=1 FL=1
MDKKNQQPWDTISSINYANINQEKIEESKTVGNNPDLQYGEGKPYRTFIIGDITSDSSEK